MESPVIMNCLQAINKDRRDYSDARDQEREAMKQKNFLRQEERNVGRLDQEAVNKKEVYASQKEVRRACVGHVRQRPECVVLLAGECTQGSSHEHDGLCCIDRLFEELNRPSYTRIDFWGSLWLCAVLIVYQRTLVCCVLF